MADIYFHSGLSGTAARQVTGLTATLQTIELLLPVDLRLLVTAFKTELAIDFISESVVAQPAAVNFCMIEFSGFEYNQENRTGFLSVNFHLGKPRSKQQRNRDKFAVDYTLNRLKNLLFANPNLGGYCGLRKLVAMSAVSGFDYIGVVGKENMREAQLSVIYEIFVPDTAATR